VTTTTTTTTTSATMSVAQGLLMITAVVLAAMMLPVQTSGMPTDVQIAVSSAALDAAVRHEAPTIAKALAVRS
jgi:hypothetical protein